MSSLRKASKAAAGGRAHKERSQPAFRARFGLLEKHKDYVLRAKDFQKKQQNLQKLKEKAANRNPDEFFFKMINSKTVKGIHRGETGAKVYTEEELKLLRSQDAGYLVSKAQSELKKVERLRSSVLPLSANTNNHVFFVEDDDEVAHTRERVVNQSSEPLQVPRVQKKLTKEMQERSERAVKLKDMASTVAMQKQLSGKGRKRKLRSRRKRLGQPRTILTKALDGEEFRMLGHEMVDFIADYITMTLKPFQFKVKSRAFFQPGYLKRLLPESAPKEQEPLEDILNDVHCKIMPGITHWQSPNFFGYYPSNTSTASILGEMLSGSLSVIGFSWITSPAATELEIIVLDWLAKLLQLPDDFLSSSKGGGVIQGTACEAVLVVMLAARKRALMKVSMEQGISEAEALGKLVVYTSDQAHSCVTKARQSGITTDNLRLIPTDASTNYALPPAVLAEGIVADTVNGLIPFFLCGVVGSTSSAAVDPLSELGDIAKEYGLCFHVDGAYAGSACICPEYRPYLDGVEKADSFDMNPHKWFLTQLRLLYVVGEGALANTAIFPPFHSQEKGETQQAMV